MRERAANHPHVTESMKEAVSVFDEWLDRYVEPSEEEKREQRAEWEMFRKLCASCANKHSYGHNPTKQELQRARNDLAEGQKVICELLQHKQTVDEKPTFHFPITSFVSLFGGPGLHGYGRHNINHEKSTSEIIIASVEGIEELIGKPKVTKLGLKDPIQVFVRYDRKKECAAATVIQTSKSTLKSLWKNSTATETTRPDNMKKRSAKCLDNNCTGEYSWSCSSCTFIHNKSQSQYLLCEMCGAQRVDNKSNNNV